MAIDLVCTKVLNDAVIPTVTHEVLCRGEVLTGVSLGNPPDCPCGLFLIASAPSLRKITKCI
jgi:hypothetical protein